MTKPRSHMAINHQPGHAPVVDTGNILWPCDSMSDMIGLVHWLVFPPAIRRLIR